jgi:thioredoxin family protein
MLPRLAVVGLVLIVVALGRLGYRRWRRAVRVEAVAHPRLPDELRGHAPRTWVVFTTPYCASCEPVRQRLAAADPAAAVLTIDATRRSDLAGAFRVRTAPTTLLADADGTVLARLVGADAVADFLRAAV